MSLAISLKALGDIRTHLEEELSDDYIIRELRNGVIDEFDLDNESFIKKVSDNMPINSFVSNFSRVSYHSNESNFVVGRIDFDNSLLAGSLYTVFLSKGGILEDHYVGVYKDERMMTIAEYSQGGLMSSPGGGARFLYFSIPMENFNYSLDNAGIRSYVLDNDMRITYQLSEEISIPLPPKITANTREIIRMSEKVADLENAIIALGGNI